MTTMLWTITRTFRIEAGHRLMYHDGRCRNVHGHSYRFDVAISGGIDENTGMVVDFYRMDEEVQTWLNASWDHAFIFQTGDQVGSYLHELGLKVYEVPWAPTAEVLAQILYNRLSPVWPGIESVTCWETNEDCAKFGF